MGFTGGEEVLGAGSGLRLDGSGGINSEDGGMGLHRDGGVALCCLLWVAV